MCLAIPARIVSINQQEAVIEIGGIRREANLWLTPEAKVGDYVLLHTGFAIAVLDENEARETLELIQAVAAAGDREEQESKPGNVSNEIRR
jgi:hydrogenase expression/formation protein HypC